MSDVVKINYSGTNGTAFDSAVGFSKAQTFTPVATFLLSKVTIRIKKGTGSTLSNFIVNIYNTDVNHFPTGPALATMGTFTSGDITTSYASYDYNSDSVTISSGNEYALAVERLDGNWGWSWSGGTSTPYAGGVPSDDSGSGWEAGNTAFDYYFNVYGYEMPQKATNPNPIDTAIDVDINLGSLNWDTALYTDTYDVYFGKTGNMVLVQTDDLSTFFVLLPYIPLQGGSAYQWRIDSKDYLNTVTGDVWTFLTVSMLSKPTDPTPLSAATKIDVGLGSVSWKQGGGATRYDVYYNFGHQGGALYLVATVNATDAGSPTVGTDETFSIDWPIDYSGIGYGSFSHNLQDQWRIDARDDTTTIVAGDVWTFTTAPIYYPKPPTGPAVWPTPVPAGEDSTIHSGDPLTLGLNNMVNFHRLVAAAGNTLYIENI